LKVKLSNEFNSRNSWEGKIRLIIIDNKETAVSFGRLLVTEFMSFEIKFCGALTIANHFLDLANTERRTESKE
jgi:hypothetical protein